MLKYLSLFIFFITISAFLPFEAIQFNHSENRDDIDLNRVDTLRILLYETQNPEKVTIYARDGHINITGDTNFKKMLTDKQPGIHFSISSSGSDIKLNHNTQTHRARKWHISSTDESLIRVKVRNSNYRYFRGDIVLSVAENELHLEIINRVSLENYIASVIGGEMNFEHLEALKAQAVISRTYALWHLNQDKSKPYDLTDHTLSQVYTGELLNKPRYLHAATATHGEIITWNNKLILAVYSSTCGGHTAANETVWDGKAYPYLRAVSDNNACRISPHFNWESSIKASEMHRLFNSAFGIQTDSVVVAEKDPHGRVKTLLPFYNEQPGEKVFTNTLRLQLTKLYGPDIMKSTFFTMDFSNNMYKFSGKGLGHGIGLCQWGANSFAENGWKYQDILKFYYSGTEIKNLHFINSKLISKAN